MRPEMYQYQQQLPRLKALKNICRCLVVVLCLQLLLSACDNKSVQTQPVQPGSPDYSLSYSAAENGSLEGTPEQQVSAGAAGLAVTAVPADGYHFVSWSDGVETATRTDSAVQENLTVVASFALNQYRVSYVAGANGSIAGKGVQSIAHGGVGSPVTTVADQYHHFVAWSDGITTASRTDHAVTADIEVTATFALDQYHLSYVAAENGRIDGDSAQLVKHGASGTRVTAVAVAGYHFDRWSDGLATPSRTEQNVTADLKLSAQFVADQYLLSYAAGENGSLLGAGAQTVPYGGAGSQVTAVPAENYHFSGWSDGVSAPQRSDSNLSQDLQVTANFAINQYRLSYVVDQNGSIAGDSSQTVAHGQSGRKVTAVPATGYHFVAWSDGLTTASRSDAPVTADLQVSANFSLNRYRLNYVAGANGSLEGASQQEVTHGSDASAVKAVAMVGYHFVAWSDAVNSAERRDTQVAANLQVSAVFAVNSYAIGGKVTGLFAGSQLLLQNNGDETLTVAVDGEFRFATELLDAGSYDVRVFNQPTAPNQTCMITNGRGTVMADHVTQIDVTCVLNSYQIGGQVSGLPEGDGVVLQNNASDKLVIGANGAFTFSKALEDGSAYLIQVLQQPDKPNWTCALSGAAGSLAGMDVTDVQVDCFPELVLRALAGIRKVRLAWNPQDFNKVTFNVCRAQEEIPGDGFARCQELKGGSSSAGASHPLGIGELSNDMPYWFQLEARYADGRQTLSKVVKAIPFGGLNDSGIDWCADANANRQSAGTRADKDQSCQDLAVSYPGQDGVQGRDAAARIRKLSKTGSGAAGFDFSKQCRSGETAGTGKCPPNPLPGKGYDDWACTQDHVTGLTWEIKTTTGLRSRDNSYSWYNADDQRNGGAAGLKSAGNCEEGGCDTQAYRQAVNNLQLCGYSDWRLPSRRELLSIIDNSRFKPAIDTRYFPNTQSDYYWSSSPYQDQQNYAWQVYFFYGEANPGEKSQRKPVRLVRGRTVTFGLDNP